ncbi:MAG: phosphoenolpyruvate carboxylase, partial [Vicinamibacteria bacterium]
MSHHDDALPLWAADDQAARLAELVATDEDLKVAPLRRDVRLLGTLLGRVIREQAGDAIFEAVERIRLLAIRHRESDAGGVAPAADAGLMAEAERLVDGLSLADAHRLTRAFAIYFDLTNLAETAHRKRRRRASRLAGRAAPQPGTPAGTLVRLREAGLTVEQVRGHLEAVEVVPVFTAHPTEVARRTVRFKHRRIAEALDALDRVPLAPLDAAAIEAGLTAEITTLWQTDDVRRQRPAVSDEVRMGLDYYADVLIDTVPAVYDEWREAFVAAYGDAPALPRLLRFGSWIGGDADGNPYVTPAVTRDALQLARETIVAAYVRRLEALVERLSTSSRRAPVSANVQARLDRYAQRIPSLDPAPESRSPHEVYRRLLGYMGWRLRQAAVPGAEGDGYPSAAAFLDDLRAIRDSLAAHQGERLAAAHLDPLIRQVETFGFHLHTLDLRQHARVHQRALAEIEEVTRPGALAPSPSSATRAVVDAMRELAVLKRVYPPASIRTAIISGATGVDDVLALVRLLEVAGVRVGGEQAARPVARARGDPRAPLPGADVGVDRQEGGAVVA